MIRTVCSVFMSDLHLWSQLCDFDALQTFLDKVYKLIEQYKTEKTEVHFYCVGDILSGADIYGKWFGEQAYDEVLPAVSHQTLAAGYLFCKINYKIQEITGNDAYFHILRGTHERRRGENFAWQFVTELQAFGLNADYMGWWGVATVAKDYQVFMWHSAGNSAIGVSPRAVQDSLIAVAERLEQYPHIKDVIIAHRHASCDIGMTHAFRVIQLGGFQQYWRRPVQRQMGGYIYIAQNGKIVYEGHIRVKPTLDPMLDIHNKTRFAKIFEEACEYAVAIGRITPHEYKVVVDDEVSKETALATYKRLSKSAKLLVKMIFKHAKNTGKNKFSINELEPYYEPQPGNPKFSQWINSRLHLHKKRSGKEKTFKLNRKLSPLGIKLIWDPIREHVFIMVNQELLCDLDETQM